MKKRERKVFRRYKKNGGKREERMEEKIGRKKRGRKECIGDNYTKGGKWNRGNKRMGKEIEKRK